MAHTPQLYLWSGIREQYIASLNGVKEIYFDRMAPAFANIEDEAKEYEQKLWRENLERPSPEEQLDAESSMESLAESIHMIAVERYQFLSLMRYRTLGLWISMLSQIWEQQNLTFLRNELDQERLKLFTSRGREVSGWGFREIVEIFASFGIELDTLTVWDKIEEMRLLVNVIKHAEGNSADKLRALRPDFFDADGWGDALELYKTSLNEEALNIKNQDFIDYYDALVQFWAELPERMYFTSQTQD